MTAAVFVLSALAVLPSDRMAMADRLFDRGAYREARDEYVALKGAEGVAADELLYRLAECSRATGDRSGARKLYEELLQANPLSRHADRARLEMALCGTDAEQRSELALLDSDSVEAPIRASALYHLGVLTDDPKLFARCVQLDPKGRYAVYAKFRHASLTVGSDDPVISRAAVTELLEIHYGPDREMGREALYLAASRSYAARRYGESGALLRRYLKAYPGDAREQNVRIMVAWCDYLGGRFEDAARMCGGGGTDDADYLLAACAYARGDSAAAQKLMRRYLADWPQGKYRVAVELPLARMEFDEADRGGDVAKILEAARRSAALSKSSGDRLRLAWALEKANRPDEAEAGYLGVAKDFPASDDAAEAMFRKAMIDLRAKKWSAAELSLAEALASGRNARRRAESLYWRGIAARELGHVEEARGFLKEAVTAGLSLDQAREARLAIADADFAGERFAAAREAYAQLVREGASERMSASKIRAVGRFLLSDRGGDRALDEAKTCARALTADGVSPEWRQAGFALAGEAEETAGNFSAAIENYRKALGVKARTEDAATVALALGRLELKAGEYRAADSTLREAVRLNAGNAARRAQAYLLLARTCEAQSDFKGACKYATVVANLFDDSALVAEAEKILAAHPAEAK